jgi:adenylate cyclase
VEVERKFLVDEPPGLSDTPAKAIEQGYLAADEGAEVRLRRKGEELLLTAKRGSGLERGEAEVGLDREQFDSLWPLTESRRLRKTRHELPHGELTIELDVYAGELDGLVVAEVEFESKREAREFEPPEWFGDEVTGDERYSNRALAEWGRPM